MQSSPLPVSLEAVLQTWVGEVFPRTHRQGLTLLPGCREKSASAGREPACMGCARVLRVLNYAETRLGSRMTLDVLASAAGLSPRMLQQEFARHLGISPLGWVRQRRLQRAREDLLTEGPAESSVTEIAMRWGFTHLGRFAQRYKEAFGESPSQTLRRSAGTAAADRSMTGAS